MADTEINALGEQFRQRLRTSLQGRMERDPAFRKSIQELSASSGAIVKNLDSATAKRTTEVSADQGGIPSGGVHYGDTQEPMRDGSVRKFDPAAYPTLMKLASIEPSDGGVATFIRDEYGIDCREIAEAMERALDAEDV